MGGHGGGGVYLDASCSEQGPADEEVDFTARPLARSLCSGLARAGDPPAGRSQQGVRRHLMSRHVEVAAHDPRAVAELVNEPK